MQWIIAKNGKYWEKWKILGKITVKGVNNTREAMR